MCQLSRVLASTSSRDAGTLFGVASEWSHWMFVQLIAAYSFLGGVVVSVSFSWRTVRSCFDLVCYYGYFVGSICQRLEVNGRHKPTREYIDRECNGVKPPNNFGEVDPWTAWAYRPRTISLLLMGTCFLMWAAAGSVYIHLNPSGLQHLEQKLGV